MTPLKKAAAETVFWTHFALVTVWYGLFLVPTSLWAGKITFHFWFILIATLVQFGWGFVLLPITKKYKMICPLTTLMQVLRGYPIADERNNHHSCIKEFFHRIGKPVPKKAVTMSTFISLGAVTLQYFSVI